MHACQQAPERARAAPLPTSRAALIEVKFSTSAKRTVTWERRGLWAAWVTHTTTTRIRVVTGAFAATVAKGRDGRGVRRAPTQCVCVCVVPAGHPPFPRTSTTPCCSGHHVLQEPPHGARCVTQLRPQRTVAHAPHHGGPACYTLVPPCQAFDCIAAHRAHTTALKTNSCML